MTSVSANDDDVMLAFDTWQDPTLEALPKLPTLQTPIRIRGTRGDIVLAELVHADAVTEIELTPSLRPGASAVTRHLYSLAVEAAVISWCPTCLRSAVGGIVGHTDGCQRGSAALGSWVTSSGPVRVVERRIRRLNLPVFAKGNAPSTAVGEGDPNIRRDLEPTESGGPRPWADPFEVDPAWSSGEPEVSTTETEMHA